MEATDLTKGLRNLLSSESFLTALSWLTLVVMIHQIICHHSTKSFMKTSLIKNGTPDSIW
jgi:hypothetical protein